ncbi:YeeE/YedE family protein [Paracoccus sp. (in: a-proteobacteria)]|uniref:YeeE/YedE family protein n=1 Tax=Paracoccus sp. TaxID=267 RepID=UPI0026DEB621|nr:YeeE/YedE thiosulfate transporter family protein [Paracoccus sp. (in: a-proteobacteria)]MDO5647793.1 YeeE/YedE thiosulfate transporter family protein [Paracoccus sp. (in: a-proteobacteria)]
MNHDWLMGLLGGLMIGGAAALYLLGNGRVMGASGIMGGLIDGSGRSAECVAFVAALIGVPALMAAAGLTQAAAPVAGTEVLVLAGLLVGFGTRLGNGCTSGHGVCGISRFSRRGIVATVVYLLTGGIAVIAARALGAA